MNSVRLEVIEQISSRFWVRVDKSGGPEACWPWTKSREQRGYGVFHLRKGEGDCGTLRSSRLAWMLTYGAIPDGLLVLHRCDNPPCCNPSHLFLGTDADNARDRESKCRGYSASGEEHSGAKLTWEQVHEIRQLRKDGWSPQVLAVRYGVHFSTIYYVLEGKHWCDGTPAIKAVRCDARLTWDQVREMRNLYEQGWSTVDLATRYQITASHVRNILLGRNWRDPDATTVREQLRQDYRATGEDHANTRLTWDQVREMRHLRNEGWKLKALAERYGISMGAAGNITRGWNWSHDPLTREASTAPLQNRP